MAVIDLSATKILQSDKVGFITPAAEKAFPRLRRSVPDTTAILHLEIDDFKAPTWGMELWEELTFDIQSLLQKGTDVLIACTGGHGRTGLALAMVCSLLLPDEVGPNPVQWARDIYCTDAVESEEQIDYIFNTLGLERPKGIQAAWKNYSAYTRTPSIGATPAANKRPGRWKDYGNWWDEWVEMREYKDDLETELSADRLSRIIDGVKEMLEEGKTSEEISDILNCKIETIEILKATIGVMKDGNETGS